jgi:hypothetical protein
MQKVVNLIEKIKVGENPLVIFTEKVEEGELEYDPGMVTKCIAADRIPGSNVWEIYTSFSEWRDHNKTLERPNFYDCNNIPCLRWSQTPSYPENAIVFWYVDEAAEGVFEFFDPLAQKL